MSTAYTLTDTLPKDTAGQKFAGWVNVATSQLDFALPAGIAPTVRSSKNYVALQVGTHVGGSKIENPSLGMALMAHYASNASGMAVGGAVQLRGDDRGQLYISSLSATACAILATSRSTITTTSGLLYGLMIATCGAVSAGQLAVLNGAASLAHVVFEQPNATLPQIRFESGTCFGSLIVERRNTVGDVFVTPIYKLYGQG